MLAIRRTTIAVYFVCHLGLILYFIYDTFVDYLTNWALTSCALTYSLMAISHCINGDFAEGKSFSTATPLESKECPIRMWTLVTSLYEWTLSIEMCVVLAFWFIEIPAMGLRGDFYRFEWVDWATLCYTHTVPVLICFTEWRNSAIPITWRRYPIYVLVGILYMVLMVFREKALEEQIYASIDWVNSPGNASIVASIILAQ